MLPRLRIIQVGDVHLASAARLPRGIDDKDERFPSTLRNMLAGPPVKTVFRKLYAALETETVDALLFMGDLADRGDLAGYKAAVSYLAGALQLGAGRRFQDLNLGLVPGNHDVDRALAAQQGMKRKFRPLQDAVQAAGLPALPIENPSWLRAERGKARAEIALLNSCWGCGERENIPSEFQTGIADAIAAAIAGGSKERAVAAYYDRQLDTPAFSAASIQRLVDDVAKRPGASVLVACAHHNILPQRTTRLAPYTELVNSGSLRNALMDLARPVLYLHGHIHEDPVEIVSTPSGGPLVCISAPEASRGYNVIELVFTHTGLPLVCNLLPWRLEETGVFRERGRQTIPISGGRRRPPNAVHHAIYRDVVSARDRYWDALVATAAAAGAVAPEDETEEALETLAADQLLAIENYELGREHWLVSCAV